MKDTVGKIKQLTERNPLVEGSFRKGGLNNAPISSRPEPPKPQPRHDLTVTVDVKNNELIQEIIEVLRHIENTTTCAATKQYLQERMDYLTKP